MEALEKVLLQWSIETLIALEIRASAGAGGIPLSHLRESIAILTSVEGFALPDASLDLAVGIVRDTLVSSGHVTMVEGTLYLAAMATDPSTLN